MLNTTLLNALPQEKTPTFGIPIAECTVFGDGYSWGSMRTADLTIASEKAAGVPIQVIGDPATPTTPSDCQQKGQAENTVSQFGANGILGVGPFPQDCGNACADGTPPTWYYSCPDQRRHVQRDPGSAQPASIQPGRRSSRPTITA